MTRKLFIIASIIFLISGIYLLSQFFFSQSKIASRSENGNSKNILSSEDGNKKEDLLEGRIKRVIEGDIRNPSINSLGSKILYSNQNNILSSSLDGTMKMSLGAYPFNLIESIEWSIDDSNAIIKDSEKYYIFNIERSEVKEFKSDSDNIIWGKIGNQLIYKFYDSGTEKRSLNISDLSGNNWEEITEVPFRDAEIILSPKEETLILFSSPVASQETNLFVVDLAKKEKREVNKKYKGASYKWSPDGKILLFSYTKDDGKTNLAVMSIEKDVVVELNFPGLVDKCVWAKDSIEVYCASPTLSDSNIILPDDWYEEKVSSTDTFWRIETHEGGAKRLLDLDKINEDVDADSLFLDDEEKNLFFVDRKTEDLFKIEL